MKISVKTVAEVLGLLNSIDTKREDQLSMDVLKLLKLSRPIKEVIDDKFEDLSLISAKKDKDGVFLYDYNPVNGQRSYQQDGSKFEERKKETNKYLTETFVDFPVRIHKEPLSEPRKKELGFVVREGLFGILFDLKHFSPVEQEAIKEDEVLMNRIKADGEDVIVEPTHEEGDKPRRNRK